VTGRDIGGDFGSGNFAKRNGEVKRVVQKTSRAAGTSLASNSFLAKLVP
jgi:hypothetical protein